ncbi:DUF1211 domain-containing protein [Mucilaginibacter corticis]|uniref:DUF1211 domain-containing protein n=1 Tax=Mucilaginibacter corticis TaxID=2597670 RepID=A0A556MS18_9SPHI|nr:TMEM175 family protein [Mucilaginibacter corticis]TSJ42675.1 DUF1211 domain-containing protein [Mucilaginibacter corticis]
MRAKAASKLNAGDSIKWRSHEPSRIETFSDAAFAFALTLIIVSIEVPKTFHDLMETMKGTLSFALCFAILFNIWNSQNIFFRRYGLNDKFTVTINAVLLFVVLIYTYPLKFLFELLTADDAKQSLMIKSDDIRELMLIYSAGFCAIYILFYLMYRHVLKFIDELQLTPAEVYQTKTVTTMNLLCVGICLLSVTFALIFRSIAGFSGYIFFLFPIAYSTWFSYRGKKKRALFPKED